MTYIEFHNKMKSFPVFSVIEIEKHFPGFDKRRLVEWQKKGYIQKLRNKYYTFFNREFESQFLFFVANHLYRPSYVSLETALARYGFIPEQVFQVISCSTLKSKRFDTPNGTFVYHRIKPSMYFGYTLAAWNNKYYTIADPEKTIIDYLYLHHEIHDTTDIEMLRWNPVAINERIDRKILESYERYIKSPALSKRLLILKRYVDAAS
jgi:predicted transcriptional regulator of viral defense system